MAAKKKCTAKTKAGKRCRNAAVVDGVCLSHAPRNVKEERGFGGPQEGSGRPRKPTPDDVLRERIEENIDKWLAPLEAALTEGKPVLTWSQAEGEHSIEWVVDPELGMKAMKFAFERAFGRPRQQVELTGDTEIKVSHDVDDPEVRELAHELLRRRLEATSE